MGLAMDDRSSSAWNRFVRATVCQVFLLLLLAGSAAAQPAAPTINAVTPGDGALTVAWTAPSGVTGITAYDLRYILTSEDETVDANWTVVDSAWTSGLLHHVLTGLTNSSGYDVQMRTVTTQDGSWSATTAATPDEPGSTRADALSLPLNTPVGGSLSSDDTDYFQITLGSTTTLALYTTGAVDTVGELEDDTGTLLLDNDESHEPFTGNLSNFLIAAGSRTSGTYYLKVTGYGGATGSYEVIARTAPESTSRTDAQAIGVGEVAFGVAAPAGDEDFFKIILAQDTRVVIRTVGTRFDMTGELQNSQGTKIAENDDGWLLTGPHHVLLRANLTAGTYYVKVQPFLGTGVFWLRVDTVTEPGSTRATAVPLVLNVLGGGTIDPGTDVDYFQLDAASTGYVVVRALAEIPAKGEPDFDIDGALLDGDGNQVAAHSYEERLSAYMAGFTIEARLDAGSTYYIKATSSAGTGPYTVQALMDARMARLTTKCSGGSSLYSDPLYDCQWHLKNTGQLGGLVGLDIDVEGVWAGGNMGAGSVVRVVDDGMDHYHEDLRANVNSSLNHDYGTENEIFDSGQNHGTQVAGIIASRDNDLGGRGVAPRAEIHGLALLGNSTEANIADAMTRTMSTVAVSNNSWGPEDGPAPKRAPAVWGSAIDTGVESGNGLKGVFYAWAAGNGGRLGDYSNLDEFNNYYGVASVCAVNDLGVRSSYSEMGANLWVCGPSNDPWGSRAHEGIFTTANYSRYSDTFGGTSAAAPVVSGVAALLRSKYPDLGWRDVKLILAGSARMIDEFNKGWKFGALKYGSSSERYAFNHEYGFGLVDAGAALRLARNWKKLPQMIRTNPVTNATSLTIPDPGGGGKKSKSETSGTVLSNVTISSDVEFIEFVEVTASFDAPSFRDLQMELWSPSGTVSDLSVPFEGKDAYALDSSFRFGSARHLGENPDGVWTLRLTDTISQGTANELESWSIRFYGHKASSSPPSGPTGGAGPPGAPTISSIGAGQGFLTISWAPPASDGGNAVTSYDLSYKRSAATDWAEVTGVWTSAASGRMRYTLAGLAEETRYDVRVRAVNGTGAGPWSTVSTAATSGGPPPPSVPPRAAFRVDPDCGSDLCTFSTGDRVRFTDTSSGLVRTRRWDFGDGGKSKSHTVAHAWATPGFYTVTLTVGDGKTASTASRVFLVEASDPAGTCKAGERTACLQDSRYRVRAVWWTGDDSAAEGTALNAASVVHAGTNETGLFWFVERDNWEILIKVLDGCSINGSMWVFGASTTDLGYSIEVADTVTGSVREYRNEPGHPAPAITDVTAFPGGCRDNESRMPQPTAAVDNAFNGPYAEAAASPLAAGVPAPLSSFISGATLAIGGLPGARPGTAASPAEDGGCTESATTLCLLNDRYEVSVAWSQTTADGTSVSDQGMGRAARPRTDDSGLFWFFADDNWEMLVKVLDGCSYNGHHWVYAASATTVGLELTVRDTENGESKTWVKEPGAPAPAITDTGAFGGRCTAASASTEVRTEPHSPQQSEIDRADGGADDSAYAPRVGDTVTGVVQDYRSESRTPPPTAAFKGPHAKAAASPLGAGGSTPLSSFMAAATLAIGGLPGARPGTAASPAEDGGCTESATTLCLLNDRYEVSVAWSQTAADGTSVSERGMGRAARPRTDDSGLFWFFADDNWEMLVKVLDGCSYNGHHWVYAASATTVGLELTVRDTENGESKTWVKEPGAPAPAITDTGAFGGHCTARAQVPGER